MTYAADLAEMSDGSTMIAVRFDSPRGIFVAFLDAMSAVKVAERLTDLSRQARSGIQLAKPGDVPPMPPAAGNGSRLGPASPFGPT
jgi:hypothetical protein